MFYQFSFLVLFNNISYFIHPFNHKHICIGNIIFDTILIFLTQNTRFLIQRTNEMIIDCLSPYKRIAIRIGFDFYTSNKKNF